MKTPIAIERDKYLDSDAGQLAVQQALQGAEGGRYARNRVELVWLAGWNACADHVKRAIDGTPESPAEETP